MPEIMWGLADPSRAGDSFWQHFQRGQQMGEEAALKGALADFTANPDDPNALREVMRRNPELGMKLADYQDRRAFRGALSEYVTGNSLLGTPQAGALNQPQNALRHTAPGAPPAAPPPAPHGASFDEAFAPFRAGAADAREAPQAHPAEQQPQADLSFLGRPQSRQDAAFLRMVQADPVEALKIQSAMRDNFVDRIKAEREFYAVAVEELSRVGDEAGWQRALQRVAPVAQALGADLSTIPQTYPGPDKVRVLLEGALPVKERLDYFLREANMEADNMRADRNTDSLIETREQQVQRQREFDQGRLENQRRGQDLTDKRQRDRPPPRGRAPARGRTPARGANSSLPLVRTPAEARALPKGTRFRTPDGAVKIVP